MFQVPHDAVSAQYDVAIVEAVKAGEAEVSFTEIHSSYRGHNATFKVFADALKIDGVRWGMGAKLMQEVADLFGCMFMTSKIADLAYGQRAISVLPITLDMMHLTTQQMSLTSTMRKYSALIDAELEKQGYQGGFVGTTGKPWIINRNLTQWSWYAINYGWHVPTVAYSWKNVSIYPPELGVTAPFRLIQQPGYVHGPDQSDYSETATLVSRRCEVDGRTMDLRDVLHDPELAGLASYEGVLTVLRQPGTPSFEPMAGFEPLEDGE